MNVSIYVHNNPGNHVDPLGLGDEEGGFWSKAWSAIKTVNQVTSYLNPVGMVSNAIVSQAVHAYEARREDGHGALASAGLAVSNLAGEVVPVNSVYRLTTGTETVTGAKTSTAGKVVDVASIGLSLIPAAGVLRVAATEARVGAAELRLATEVAATTATEGGERTIFRAMRVGADGLPEASPSARGLGVRPNTDIPVSPEGTVRPAEGGMSVALDSPANLPPVRRPISLGGTGKDPVFSLKEGDLPEGLKLRVDAHPHGLVEPAHEMPLDIFQKLLEESRKHWKPH